MRPNINSSKPLDDAQKASIGQWRGTVAAGWSSLDDLLAGAGGADLAAVVKTSRAEVEAAHQRMDQLAKSFDGSGKPAMPAPEDSLTPTTHDEPFDSPQPNPSAKRSPPGAGDLGLSTSREA